MQPCADAECLDSHLASSADVPLRPERPRIPEQFAIHEIPSQVAQDPLTGLYVVADTGNSRIQMFRQDGTLQRVIPTPIAPTAVVVDTTPTGQRLLVAPLLGNALTVIPVTADPPGATDR